MSSRSFKPNRIIICGIDQDPVGFDMAIMRWFPLSNKGMIPVLGVKLSPGGELSHNGLKFYEVFPASPHLLDIAGELGGLRDPFHFFQLSNMASIDSNS